MARIDASPGVPQPRAARARAASGGSGSLPWPRRSVRASVTTVGERALVPSARPAETWAPRLARRDLGCSGRHCDTTAAVLGSQNVVARLPLRAPAPRCRSRHPATLWSHRLHEDSNAWQGSTSRGRRGGGAIESGRTSVGGLAGEASCSHRAQGGFCVRPTQGLGSLARLRHSGMGEALGRYFRGRAIIRSEEVPDQAYRASDYLMSRTTFRASVTRR